VPDNTYNHLQERDNMLEIKKTDSAWNDITSWLLDREKFDGCKISDNDKHFTITFDTDINKFVFMLTFGHYVL